MSAADALVERLPRVTLVVGKGGVGKTTAAAALALHASRRSGKTLLLSTDPARALPSVLDQPVGSDATPMSFAPELSARLLDTTALRERFMERWGNVVRAILDRGTYLDDSDIAQLVDTALPGGDEIFAALELATLLAENENRTSNARLFVDTAPTGHTLRLLNLPATFRALVALLDAMQAKHRFMVRALTRSYRADAADGFLAEMERLVTALDEALHDSSRCAAVMVANTQPLVLEETRRYLAALRDLRIEVVAVVWNGTEEPAEAPGSLDAYMVPRLDRWPVGEDGLEYWLSRMKPAGRAGSKATSSTRRGPRESGAAEGNAESAALIRSLTIVAGKGGVGKTTVAAALALDASRDRRTLVVSTDPAPSLADALDQDVPDADTAVPGADNLTARQMDATAAFARLRSDYQSRVDALFEGIVARGVDLAHDRAIARDLFALAPPGIDEVYALARLSDALFRDRYRCVIVDPAPTGHLLRLLEMPQLALTWSHQLMRLMLKYKDVTGLGETAAEVLEFSRDLRAVDALLRDSARAALVLVTLDEPVVHAETERLAAEVRAREIAISGVVVNRASAIAAPLPVPDAAVHFQAPAVTPSPVGVDALRRWRNTWKLVDAQRRNR